MHSVDAYAGFRKVPDGAVILTPEERDEEMKGINEILTERDELKTEIECLKSKIKNLEYAYKERCDAIGQLNAEHNRALETIKTQCMEIGELKAKMGDAVKEFKEYEE